MRAKLSLDGFAENVSGRVPEGVLAFWGFEIAKLQLAIGLERTHQIPGFAVDQRDHHARGETLGDTGGDIERRGLASDTLHNVAVGQSYLDWN